ncbi:Fc.00g047650.m01.CDS01 [Cosmosporella sp. VM-42]
MASPTPSIQGPQTPPRRKARFSVREPLAEDPQAGLSPSAGSTSDSGVEDVFDSPLKPKALTAGKLLPPKNVSRSEAKDVEAEEEEQKHEALKGTTSSLADEVSCQTLMPENPFDSEHSKILFNAIDQLQSFGSSDYLKTPQLIIVGGQSTGKSSLLQSLTNIPFPVGTGCCTRFPTRIVSRRTAPKSRDSFRITIEKAEVCVKGLQPASEKYKEYEYVGDTLSTDEFIKVMDKISSDYMCIRKGLGDDKRNFAAEVLRIELSGPSRSYFSILDLPGIFHNNYDVNESDIIRVKNMVVEYMKNTENIVICVASAPTDLASQEIFKMASENVQKNRLVGVFTKCDMLKHEAEQMEEVVSIASGKTAHPSKRMQDGWFLVRNRTNKDSESFNLEAAEDRLFSSAPWNSLSKDHLGSVALKTYLGTLLSAKIRTAFPKIQESIQNQLAEKSAKMANLGEPRNSHLLKQKYLTQLVSRYEKEATRVLERPGDSEDSAREIRREISRLNNEFGTFMREKGATWAFAEDSVDPQAALKRILKRHEDGLAPEAVVVETNLEPTSKTLEQKFPDCSAVGHPDEMGNMILKKLDAFRGALLPGVINPEIYPVIYRQQVAKWTKITRIHLRWVWTAVKNCFEAILREVCPPSGSTAQLHQRLTKILTLKFEETYLKFEEECMKECDRETERKFLLTNNPSFETELLDWRRLRFWRRQQEVIMPGKVGVDKVKEIYDLVHATVRENMVCDVHDALKVYYKQSIEKFISDITMKHTNEFMSDPKGPIAGLTQAYILTLSPEDVESLASEDETALRMRQELKVDIEMLQGAHRIAEEASERTANLGRA